jgi:hypothetical protein
MSQADGTGEVAAEERSTGDLVKLVGEQVSVLVRDELKLAQPEMTRKGKQAGTGIGMIGGGGLERQGRYRRNQGSGATVMGSALPEEIPGHQGDEARQLKEEIERTREHLGATVDQLVAQVDVKSPRWT